MITNTELALKLAKIKKDLEETKKQNDRFSEMVRAKDKWINELLTKIEQLEEIILL